MKLLWKESISIEGVEKVAQRIISSLESSFCLWMKGDIGAGKTTLTSSIFHELGLDSRIPVTSPTFTYLNEYEINGRLYGHWDLYRSEGDFSIEDLGHVGERDFVGMVVEWPERLADSDELLPTHLLKINYDDEENSRAYELYKM